ncbi:alpha/beta fold hydrolase [Jannaschia sp. KMU-145]|uniref:alpha/beta fold hydrolase n=1 Tax=Jannaschia halovivens TaxID=3388667 RepID=UPI00396B04A6
MRDATFRVRRRSAAAGAPELVFVPALGTGAWVWEGVAERMPTAWGITLYDLRGQGRSGGQGERISDHAADLLALAPEGAVVCGLSIGGQIAMRAALDAPDRFAGLVLADTAPRIGSAEYYDARAKRIEAEGMAPFAAEQVRRWFAPAFDDANVIARAQRALAAQPVAGYLAACRAIGACNLSADLARLKLPVLCLGGAEDVSTPPDTMRALAAGLPRATCEIVAGAGHLPPVETPDAVAALVAAFVRDRHPAP